MKEFKYYTLVGVNLSRGKDMVPNYTRDFMLRWTTNERKSCITAKKIKKDKLFKTTPEEAADIAGIGVEVASLQGIRMRMMHCPEISAHLFETEFLMKDRDVDIIIDCANKNSYGMKLLMDSRINI